MIKHSGKRCTVKGCNNFLYARGYCMWHYKSLYLYPRQKSRNKLSKRKQDLNDKYIRQREEFIENQRKKHLQRKIFCIFCSKEIKGEPSLHHALGRDDAIMLDERFWFLSHNSCHVNDYHSKAYYMIPWWDIYIDNIKSITDDYVRETILRIEVKRMDKSNYEREKRKKTNNNNE